MQQIVPRKINPLVTVMDDLCTLHVGQVLCLTVAMLEMETCVRGFHVYKVIWEAAVVEELKCRRKRGNRVDRYAVVVVKDEAVVEHVSWMTHSQTLNTATVIVYSQRSQLSCITYSSKQCNNLIIRGFNFRGCLSTVKTAKIGPPRIIPAIRYIVPCM